MLKHVPLVEAKRRCFPYLALRENLKDPQIDGLSEVAPLPVHCAV